MPARAAEPGNMPAGAAWVQPTAEINRYYTPDCLCAPLPAGRDGDRWAWDRLQAPTRTSASYPIELSAVDTSKPARLDVWLIGFTDIPEADPDHSVDVALNGVSIGNITWNGKQAIYKILPVEGSRLQNGTNTLTLSLTNPSASNVEGAWLDAFSILHARSAAPAGASVIFEGEEGPHAYTVGLDSASGVRAYDVTDPDRPERLTGLVQGTSNSVSLGDASPSGAGRYWIGAEAGILSPARLRPVTELISGISGADYLILTPAEFAPALEPLVALRQSQGLSVAIEHVQAIYDVYGDGRPDPAALRAFLAQAYATWNSRPTYVLLAGDGTTDPKRYHSVSSKTFIPPYLAEVDPWAGETAADNRYVAVDGDDILPDMLIGRLPVNSPEETQAVVAKIVQYELNPAPGIWNRTAVFVADDTDPSGDFPAFSESIATAYISEPYSARRFYYTPSEDEGSQMRQEVLEALSQGAGLLAYAGHSSVHQWATERFLHSDVAAQLNNQGRLPVVLELTCFTGSFQLPASSSIDEALLRNPHGGAVAAWGSTGLGISTGHSYLAQGFMGSLMQEGNPRIGAAALAGKLRLAAGTIYHHDLIDTYNLLGDPATAFIQASQGFMVYLPQLHR
jgi:hypothetical protein